MNISLTDEEFAVLKAYFKCRGDLKACQEAFRAYGGNCPCGETRVTHLTLDHVNGGGTKHRQALKRPSTNKGGGVEFYKKLRKAGFPNDPPLMTLCIACHEKKDGCTHHTVVERRQRWVDLSVVAGPLLERLRSLGYQNRAIEEMLGLKKNVDNSNTV